MRAADAHTRCRSRNTRWAFHFSGAGRASSGAEALDDSMLAHAAEPTPIGPGVDSE